MKKFQLPPEYDTEKLQELVNLFPQFWRESYFDFDEFKSYVSGIIPDDLQEKYSFTWHGKTESYRRLKKNSHGTLRPCKEDSVNWGSTKNLYLEGDNLEVLKLIKHTYVAENGVKMIYIDPPYNTGNDFIYDDNFIDSIDTYLEYTNQEGKAIPESSGRYHTKWLNMMYPRLWLANYLLRDDGVIFISIDDNELYNLRKICNEVFGEENFRNLIQVRRYDKNLNRQFMGEGLVSMNVGLEYILVYAKSPEMRFMPVFREANEERSSVGYWKGFWNNADRPTMRYEALGFTPETGQWKWGKELADEAIANYIEYTEKFASNMTIEEYWENTGKTKKFLRRNPNGKGMNKGVEHWVAPSSGILRTSNWSDLLVSKPTGVDVPFDSPKNPEVIMELIKLSGAESDALILDFFSGSASTAHAVMQLNAEDGGNRRFIMVQLPEITDEKSETYKAGYKNICEIGKERIRRAGAEIAKTHPNVDVGFRVFKLDKSNFKIWDDTPVDSENPDEIACFMSQLEMHTHSPFINGRSHDDIVYEIMRINNDPLTTPVIPIEINGETVYGIGEDCDFIVCIDIIIDEAVAEKLCTYNPKRILLTDSCFKDTETMVNVEHTIRNIDENIKLRVV